MKLKTCLLTSLLTASAMAADNNATQPLTVKQEGVKYIKMLGGALKTQLKAHMKKDPTGLDALAFCTGSADNITKEVNTKLPDYAKVRRTALKVRNNSVNTPDATDKKVMQDYEEAIAAKTFTPKDIKVVQEGDVTRVYKPLVTKPVCLKCHGSELNPKIADGIKSAYPQDKAIGFKEGDLRGVIVAEIKKH
ncbi:Cytochrome c family protein [hydrothermal vent metagenome]|uniref:Cytochrome c family protein n=1 Tax=hydrothermal vent metagenome TaxID=652676 RepID=A0A1W1C5Z0_9ZZZZ